MKKRILKSALQLDGMSEEELCDVLSYTAWIIAADLDRDNAGKLDFPSVADEALSFLVDFCQENKGYVPDSAEKLFVWMDVVKYTLAKRHGWKINKECRERVEMDTKQRVA